MTEYLQELHENNRTNSFEPNKSMRVDSHATSDENKNEILNWNRNSGTRFWSC